MQNRMSRHGAKHARGGGIFHRMIMTVVLLATITLSGCGRLAAMVEPTTVTDPVWAADGWIYYLREVSSDGAELWRQRERKGSAERVLSRNDLGTVCAGGVFSFLYQPTGSEIGVGVECDGGRRTELATYSDGTKHIAAQADLPFLGEVAFRKESGAGYAEVPRRCGSGIKVIVDGKLSDFAYPVTVDGKTFNISGGDAACGAVAWVRSPAAAANRLFFMAAPDSLGRLSGNGTEDLESFRWHLVVWDEKERRATSLAEIPGVADLAVSPDGNTVIVAVSSPAKKGGVWAVNALTGKKVEVVGRDAAYHPSVSPDGQKFVYADSLRELKFASFSGRVVQ